MEGAAAEAFRKCSAELLIGIQNPELLAWQLYSDEVVSETVADEVSVVGLSAVQRKTRLLSAVRDQITVDPNKFQNLLQALRKQPPLKDVADKLETIYNNCGMYACGGYRGWGLSSATLWIGFAGRDRHNMLLIFPIILCSNSRRYHLLCLKV